MEEKVSFDVAGAKIVGILRIPSAASETGLPLPAVVVAGPMTSIKEQVTGFYASKITDQGVISLVIDHRHYGESEGLPRQFEYYRDKIQDLVAAVDYLSTRQEVDSNKIGAVGICLGCGYASWTAIENPKIKWLGLIVGYYRDVPAMKEADPEGFEKKVAEGRNAREHFEKTGEVITIPAASMEGDAAMQSAPLVDYYGNRASVPNYQNSFAVMSREHFLLFDVQSAACKLTVPVTMVHSKNALSPSLAQKFFDSLSVSLQKDMMWLEGDNQPFFYDNHEKSEEAVRFILEHNAAFL